METRLIMEGEAPTPPIPGHDRASPRSGKCGDANYASTCHGDWDDDQRFGNRPYKESGYGTKWGPHTGGRDRSMDASKLYKVAGCKQGDAQGSAPYRVYKCIRPLSLAHTLPDRTFEESSHRRNRGRVRCLCGLIDDPCSASWFVCFPVPLWGRAKPFEEHYYALRATICVFAIPPSTAYAHCATGAYPKLGSSGSTSYYACNATAGIRTKIYGSTDTAADGGGAFTGSGPGVSSPGGGTIKKRRDCKVSFSILAFEFANEVVLRKGFGCAKLVRTTYIFASSESKSVAAVATCCAALKAMEMRMPTGHMDENVPKRLMKLEMMDMLRKAGWPMEMRSFFPRSGISASGPPVSSAGCPDYRGDGLLLFPEKWRCLWCLAVRPRRSGIAWSVSGSACSGAHCYKVYVCISRARP